MSVTCADIFGAMPHRFQPQAAANWETTLEFDVSGEGGGTWTLTIQSGKCEVRPGPAESPKAKVITDAETWIGINTGKVNAMQAFMTGKLKAQGNMAELLKLQNPAIFRRPPAPPPAQPG